MKKILVANRGEIAVRVIRACHDLGLKAVAVYSQADEKALHVLYADEAICIGPEHAKDSYLKIPNILSACEILEADAIHPGYGFLSENADFVSICEKCGITFIGPTSKVIGLLGDKAQAKMIAKAAGCPTVPGSDGVVRDAEGAKCEGDRLGYPVLIKASLGGGGKGIKVVRKSADMESQFLIAKREAMANFGCDDVYIEKMIVNPRHIEVQILGDKFGNVIHLGERDCSIQYRMQKLIEETPCEVLSESLRNDIGEAAIRLAKYAGYSSAGTIEFLLDEDRNFYFMEMNTRIQVEHTVTEEVTGIDLVKQQILIASGDSLKISQNDICIQGHSMQFRINARNAGLVEYYSQPGGPGVRVDSACYSGLNISPFYDSLIAKLIIRSSCREESLKIARRALSEFHVGGIVTTIPFHKKMLLMPSFISGDFDLSYVDKLKEEGVDIFSQDL